MAKTVGQWATQAASIGPRVEQQLRKGVVEASMHLKHAVEREMVVAGVGGGRLSGVGRKGARVGVRFDVKGTGRPASLLRATGPFHLIERGTKPHRIAPKPTRRRTTSVRASGGPRVLRTPYGPKASVKHPGTKGKHPWERGITRAEPEAQQILRRAFLRAVGQTFRL